MTLCVLSNIMALESSGCESALCVLSNVVVFGHDKLLSTKTANNLFVTSQRAAIGVVKIRKSSGHEIS